MITNKERGIVRKIISIICSSMLILSCGLELRKGQALKESSVIEKATDGPAAALVNERRIKGFTLKETGTVRLAVRSAVSPTLQISSYSTGAEKMAFIVGCLVATGTGLAFVAPLATVPAAVGPLANAAAGTTAVGVSMGEAFSLDYLLGQGRARVMKEAVSSVDMVAALESSLERFLSIGKIKGEDAKGGMEVIIAGYGFHMVNNDEVCSFIDVRTELKVTGNDPIRDQILLGWNSKDDDIPTPYCTTLKRFLEEDGLLARQTLQENTEIAAAIITKRLQRNKP
jgi:hypothetical protein